MSAVADRYDHVMYTPEYVEFFDGTDFANFGFWTAGTASASGASANLMERLLGFIPQKTGRILDVACGKGATTKHLLRYYRAEDITGVNISEKQLATARANVPGATFLAMDATDLRFPDASFDAVICVEAAFHFNTRERFLSEAHRVLRPGGRLVLSDVLMTLDAEKRREHRHEANYLPNPVAYQRLLLRCGFDSAATIDATEQCWRSFFRYVTRFWHEKYLRREIDRETLKKCLETNYARVPDLERYLLAAARKGEGPA